MVVVAPPTVRLNVEEPLMLWVVGSETGIDPALLKAVEYEPRLPTLMVYVPAVAPEPTVALTVESETEDVSRFELRVVWRELMDCCRFVKAESRP
jgi:hypothetical protein